MTDPIVPIIGGQRPETELQRRIREAERNRVAFSVTQALNRDPNKVAERLNLNLASTVDDYVVAEAKRRRDVERVTGRTAMSPITSEWLSNPDYSGISWDDADNLVNVERGVIGTIGDIFTELAGGTVDAILGAATTILSAPDRMIEAYRTAGYSPPAFRKMLLEDLKQQGYTGRQLKRVEQQITPQTQEEWIQEGGILPGISSVLKQAQEGLAAGQVFSQQLITATRTPLKELLGREGVDPTSTRAAIYSGFRSLPPMLAVAPLYPVLGVHGAGAAFVVPLYGNAINRARSEGLDEASAHTYALGQAGIEYLTNIIPGGKFLAGMKLKSPLFQRIKDQLPAELVQENIATATQDLLDMAVLEPEKTFEEYLRERPLAAWHTIVATTVGVGALNTAIRVAERMGSRLEREEQASQIGGNMIADLIDSVRESETQKRSPRAMALFINKATETQGTDRVRIEAETLSQILSESDQQAEFLEQFPDIAQQLNQNGTDPGTEVELKTGDYVSLMSLDEKYQDIAAKMQPNLRVGTAQFSLAEESAIEEERQAIREGLEEQARDTVEREERNAQQRTEILGELTDFASQMPGITPKQARAQAEVAVTMWESLARDNNMDVGQLWELMKPTLVAGEITIPELPGRGALFQPEQIDAPYTAAIEAGDMETAQRLVLDAAKRAGYSEQVYEHATDQEFDVFDINAPRVNAAKGGNPAGLYFSLGQTKYEGKRIVRAVLKYTKLYDLFGKNEIPDSAVEAYKQALRDEKLSPNEFWLNEKAEKFRKTGRMPTTGLSRLAQTRVIQRAGYDGIKDGQDVAVFSPEQVKVVDPITRDADGNVIPISKRFDVEQPSILYAPQLPRITPEQDAAYMEAVESGDTQAQQVAVDQRAKAAGYDVEVFRGVAKDREDIPQQSFEAGFGIFTNDNPDVAHIFRYEREYGEVITEIYNEETDEYEEVEPGAMYRLYINKGRSLDLSRDEIQRDGYSYKIDPQRFTDDTGYQKSVLLVAKEQGYDSIVVPDVDEGVGEWTERGTTIVLFRPEQLKSADPITRDADGNVIPLSQRFDVTQESILYAPETGDDQRRGAYLPRSMQIILTEKADASTLIHEFTHHYLHTLSVLARNADAPETITSQFDTLLNWFGVENIAAWDALPAEQKAVHHEAFTYNFEAFIGTGKAPTKKLQKVFTKLAKWMRRIYGQIRSTLNAAYRQETKRLTGVERDLPALTPEVRQVFETMLGAETDVAEAAAEMAVMPIFRTQEESNMSDQQWEAYNVDAELYIDEATNQLTASTARAQRWLDNATARVIRAKNKKAKEQRKAIRERIAASVEQQPVYRAMTMLRRGIYVDDQGNEQKVDGPHRLNSEMVRNMFPQDAADPGYVDLSPLRAGRYGMMAKNGVDPAVVAEQFGFASAADLVKALVAARPINDVINEQTDAEITENHPELKPEAIKQAAMEALHNEALARFKATELKFLAGINRPVRIIMEAARREAEVEISRLSRRSIQPSKYLAAERRAGKAAERWMAKGDRQAYAEQMSALQSARAALRKATKKNDSDGISAAQQKIEQAQRALQEARVQAEAASAEQPGRATVNAVVRAKWNELYQGMLYREAVAARKRFDKHAKYLRRIAKQKDRGKKIGADHSEQIDHILRRLNIRGVSARTAQQMQNERVKFQAWLQEQAASGTEYLISDAALNIASQRPIEDIPMDSLDEIVEVIEQIYHAGDRVRNAYLMNRQKKLDEIKQEIIGNVVRHAGKVKPSDVTPNTVFGRTKKAVHMFFVQHIKTSTKAYVMDGGEYGAIWDTIVRTANRNQGAEQIEVSEVTKKVQGIMEPFFKAGSMTKDSGAVLPRRVYNRETGEWTDDPNRPPRSLSREEVFVLALDLGNESNIQRVVDGFGITLEEAQQIVSVLTTEELNAVQQIWDLFASFKPRVSEMERRLNGKEPNYLTPRPITLVSSDGTAVELNGGYFPVKYDRSGSELGTSIEAATQAKMQLDGAFVGNQTRDSYKKTRAARVVNRPLLLQTSRMFSGLNEIIHDLHWREWLVDINLIMRPDGSVSRAIIENYGSNWMEDIRRWIKDIAAAGPGPMHPAEQWLGLMRRFISISRLGFSPVTAAIQQTGLVVAAQHVGPKHAADAMSKWLGDMKGANQEMLEKSPEMRMRFQTRFRELGEVAARVSGKKDWVMALERGGYSMILASQMIPDTVTWHAAYSRAFEDNPGISDKEAADRAFQAVLDTQGSGDLVNLSTIERGGPGSKLLTVFYTWQNTLFNEIYKIAKTEGLSAEGMTRLATLAVALPFITVLIRDIVPDDEDELKKRRTGTGAMTLAEQYAWRTLEESINTLLGSVVGVREIASPIASILSGERPFEYRGPAGFAPIADLIAVFNAGAESGVISKRFGKRMFYFLGDLSGIPATQINRTWDGIDAVMSGDDVPWWAVIFGTQK